MFLLYFKLACKLEDPKNNVVLELTEFIVDRQRNVFDLYPVEDCLEIAKEYGLLEV